MIACARGWANAMRLWDTSYSRVIAWLKILLPVAALGLLSTLFLLSSGTQGTDDIPFTEVELETKVRDQSITAPFYAGTTSTGASLSLTADTAKPDAAKPGRMIAQNVQSILRSKDGATVRVQSDFAALDDTLNRATLDGNVRIKTSAGYEITTESLISGLDTAEAETLGPISGNGPPGRFDAGKMRLRTDPNTGQVHLVFTNGIKLVYDPTKQE